MIRARQAAKDWGGILTGIAALAGVAVTYVVASNQNDGTDQIAALQEAKLEKVYMLLTNAIEGISVQQMENARLIGDLREAVGELRGAFGHLNNRRVRRALEDAPALRAVETAPDVVGMGGVGFGMRGTRRAAAPSAPKINASIQLPLGIEVEPETVQKKLVEIKEMKAAK